MLLAGHSVFLFQSLRVEKINVVCSGSPEALVESRKVQSNQEHLVL